MRVSQNLLLSSSSSSSSDDARSGVEQSHIVDFQVVGDHFMIDGVAVDLEEILRDKIYRKRGGVNMLRKCFKALDKSSNGKISRREFRQFLLPFNLNLSVAALTALVNRFDSNGDNQVDFNEFCKKTLSEDYKRGKHEELLGVPAITHNRMRRIVKPTTPFTTGLGEMSTDPVSVVRRKINQKCRGVNDAIPARELRDACDPTRPAPCNPL